MNWFCEYIVRPFVIVIAVILAALLLHPIVEPWGRGDRLLEGGLVTAVGAIAGLKGYRCIESIVKRRRNGHSK